MNQTWKTSREIKDKLKLIIGNYLDKDIWEPLELNDLGVNPNDVIKVLEESFDYRYVSVDSNGWEQDFEVELVKPDSVSLSIVCTGYTFSIELHKIKGSVCTEGRQKDHTELHKIYESLMSKAEELL